MFGYLLQAACGVFLIATGSWVVGSVILGCAGITAAFSGTDEDGEDE
ncbi:hypothetical protein [Gemmata sp.]